MEFLTDPQLLIAFLTLTALELVLGIDNVIFISILVDKLPPEKRAFARRLGLFLAMFMRIGLLMVLSWMADRASEIVELALQRAQLVLERGDVLRLGLLGLRRRLGRIPGGYPATRGGIAGVMNTGRGSGRMGRVS